MERMAIGLLLIVALLAIGFIALNFAPETSSMLLGEKIQELACLEDAEGHCLVMPNVSGINIDSEPLNFPDSFSEDYYLVVMPFDREQQVLAVTWLPLFREIAAQHENFHYFSIAALPDLNPAIRLLVIGGMSSTLHEDEVRSQLAVLFLEEQDAFLDALAIDNIEVIQIFVMNNQGVIFYRDSGEYEPQKGQSLQEFIKSLQL